MSLKAEKPDPSKVASEALTIHMLQDTVKSLEETKLKLLLNIKELKEKLEQQKSDQADIYYYLNRKCDESFEIIAALEEQLSSEQSDREIAEKLYESKIEEMKQNSALNETRLQARINELDTKVEMLSTFSQQKDELENNLRNMGKALEEERKRFKETTEMMENKFLVEREKLRKSYDLKYESIKKELEASMDGKLSAKTQKTQIMNVVMKKELDTQSRHADRLLEINASIVEKDKKMKLELELAQSYGEELSKKLNSHERKIKSLTEDLNQANENIKEAETKHKATMEIKDKEIDALIEKIKNITVTNEKGNKYMDEMWEFLSTSYKRLKLVNTASSSRARNSSATPYTPDELLIELVKELAVKYPDQIRRYVDAGILLETKMSGSKRPQTGIPSWDNSTAEEKKSVDSTNVGVQTDDTSFIFPVESSSWLNQGSVDSYQPIANKWQSRSDVESMNMGIHSVPTVIHRQKLIVDSDSIGSNEVDAKSIRSHNYALPSKKPTMPRADFIAKTRPLVPFASDFYSSSDNYRLPLPENVALPPSRKVNKIKHKPETSLSLDDNTFKNIKISGKKFAPPIVLPKILPSTPTNNYQM